jgi:CheY-like chemotaxis protein
VSDTAYPLIHETRHLAIIDDDLMSREVLTLLALDAGFHVDDFESGEDALAALPGNGKAYMGILSDMQMPGISGEALANKLRETCGDHTTLIAMSGSAVPPERTAAFDGFLLKPFTIDDLCEALDGEFPQELSRASAPDPALDGVLNRIVYESFSKSLTAEQLDQLYTMSLDDADRRIGQMQEAVALDDDGAYRRAAHSIKGGCGMVGATQLARIAAVMEDAGLANVDEKDPLLQFLDASARLRRILGIQQK